MDIPDKGAVQQRFRLDPEIVPGLALALGVGDQRRDQLQDVLFRVDVSKGVMLSDAAAKIDRGLGNEVAENASESAQNPLADFQPVMRRTRKPGTGCITELNDHLFEGRYSPTWPDGTKHSKCVYAHTREECEEKLAVLIQQLNAERKAIQDRLRGIPSSEKLTKKQRQIWEYMRLCPDETNYSAIAKGANVTRHTVAKHYEMIRKMVTPGA